MQRCVLYTLCLVPMVTLGYMLLLFGGRRDRIRAHKLFEAHRKKMVHNGVPGG